MDIETAVDECLKRLAAGESLASCLASFPEQARELAPMLEAAQDVRLLQTIELTPAQKLGAKMRLREALAGQRTRSPAPWWARLAPVAAVLAVVLFIGVAVTAVAGSQPGDFAYGVRVVVERAPAWVQVSNQGRTLAELAVAERRLKDISSTAGRPEEVSPVALNALVRSVEAATRRAERLSEEQRVEVVREVKQKVAKLLALADETTDPAAAARLRAAAERILRAATRLEALPPHDDGVPGATPTVASVLLEPEPFPGSANPTAAPTSTSSKTESSGPVPEKTLAAERSEPAPVATATAPAVATRPPRPTNAAVKPVMPPRSSTPPARPTGAATREAEITAPPKSPGKHPTIVMPTLPAGHPQERQTPRPRPKWEMPTMVVPVRPPGMPATDPTVTHPATPLPPPHATPHAGITVAPPESKKSWRSGPSLNAASPALRLRTKPGPATPAAHRAATRQARPTRQAP